MSESNPQNILQAAEAFCWAAERAFDLGIQHNYGGNISARLGPDRFLTKPTGIGLIDCSVSDLVVTDDKGRPLEGYAAPTKEIQVHLALFRARPDVHAIIHYHTPYATAYANAQKPLPLPTLHARRILKKVPVLPELSEGSDALARAVAAAFSDADVKGVLMCTHGLNAVGPNLREAQYVAELMEESAQIEWNARILS